MDQQELSTRQFGAKAGNYLTSPVHSTGADLDRLSAVAGQLTPVRALDLGCGAGHASFALARGGARRVTAFDPSPDMLTVVAREAVARGCSTLETSVGTAEALPFDDGTFELVVTRYSAHHWADVPRALAECARVMSPGGRLVSRAGSRGSARHRLESPLCKPCLRNCPARFASIFKSARIFRFP